MTTVSFSTSFPGSRPRSRGQIAVVLVDGGAGGSAGGQVIGDATLVRLDATGSGTAELVRNDLISPAGTFYRCTLRGSSPTVVRNIRVTSDAAVSWSDPAIQVVSPVPPAFVQQVIGTTRYDGLVDVDATGAHAPTGGQVPVWDATASLWRPGAPAGGATGPAGPAGPVGAASTVPGPIGPVGPIGATGPASTVPGPAGQAGAQGPVGSQGPIGATGLTGATGPASTVPGPAGAIGATGATGAASTVPGPAGATGPIGPIGATGPAGTNGTNGATGPAGVVAATAPATYNSGTQTIGVALGTTATTAAAGNDTRLSDARPPTAHATTHAAAGSDPTLLAASQITSGALSPARLATGTPAAGMYPDGAGAWTALPSGGGAVTPVPWVGNRWALTWPIDEQGASSYAWGANIAICFPVVLVPGRPIIGLGVRVSTAVAGAGLYLGLYSGRATGGGPGAAILNPTTKLDASTTGRKELTGLGPYTTTARVLWGVVQTDTAGVVTNALAKGYSTAIGRPDTDTIPDLSAQINRTGAALPADMSALTVATYNYYAYLPYGLYIQYGA
jgi:hypothetical protein